MHGGPTRGRRVINIYGQHAPSPPSARGLDSEEARLAHFRRALMRLTPYLLATRKGEISVAFPYKVGCGLARGNWTLYQKELLAFADAANRNDKLAVKVVVYRLPGT